MERAKVMDTLNVGRTHEGGAGMALAQKGFTLPPWFWSGGASLLYGLSAVSILYGIAVLIGPVLASERALMKTMPCLGALQVYELALMGVLCTVVLWRRAYADAVSLLVIVSIFLAASAIGLSTVANDSATASRYIGIGFLILAVAKLAVLRFGLRVNLPFSLLLSCLLLLIWNFQVPTFMAKLVGSGPHAGAVLLASWRMGEFLILAGAVLFLIHLARTSSARVRAQAGEPMFFRPGLGWCFTGILLAISLLHHGALSYIFDVPITAGEYLPTVVVCALILLEAARALDKRSTQLDATILAMPLLSGITITLSAAFPPLATGRLGSLFWHPSACFVVVAVYLCVRGLALRRHSWCGAAIVYLLGGWLLFGVHLSADHVTAADLNWAGVSIVAMGVLMVTALITRDPRPALTALYLAALCLLFTKDYHALCELYGLGLWHTMGLVIGTGTIAVHVAFASGLSRWHTVAAAGLVTLSLFQWDPGTATIATVVTLCLCAMLSGLVWWRTRDAVTSILLVFALPYVFYVSQPTVTGWHFVLAGFVLLASGMVCTLLFSAQRPEDEHFA